MTKEEVKANKGTAAGRDIKNSEVTSFRDVIGTDAIKEVLAHKQALDRSTNLPVPVQTSPMPTLKCVARWVTATYEDHPGKWIKVPENFREAERVAVAIFENPSAPKDRPGIPLKDIEANLKIRGSAGSERINTTYWMNSDCSRMDLPPGQERVLILGRFNKDGLFLSNENEHTFSIQSDWQGTRYIGEEKHVKSVDTVKVEVNLVESKKPFRTIERVIIEIDVATNGIQVTT